MATKMGANRDLGSGQTQETGLSDVDTSAVFRKEKLIASSRFSQIEKDVLSELLSDGESYSLAQVESKMTEFLEGSV